MRRDLSRILGGVVASAIVVAGAACSSKSTSGAPSSSASARPSSSALASVASKPAPPPKAAPLKCPDDFYRSEEPEYCLKLEQARPGRAQSDGDWVTSLIGPMASISTSRTLSLESAIAELRGLWGGADVKERSKYAEEIDGARTIIRYRAFDARADPEAKEGKDILVVLGRSGDMTLRCLVQGELSSPEVCLSLVLPQ